MYEGSTTRRHRLSSLSVVTPSAGSPNTSTPYETVRQAVNRLEEAQATFPMTAASLSSTSAYATQPASSSLPAPASSHPPSRKRTPSHSSVTGRSRSRGSTPSTCGLRGGYQVGREPDDYPLFLAVREQDVDAWETFFESFDLPHRIRTTAPRRVGRTAADRPRATRVFRHRARRRVPGDPESRDNRVYARELRPIQSGLAMLDRMYGGPRPQRHVSRDRTGAAMSFNNRSDALIELLEELTQKDHEYVLLSAVTLSQRSMLASQRTSTSSSRRTPRLTSPNSSNGRASKKRTATPRSGSTTPK